MKKIIFLAIVVLVSVLSCAQTDNGLMQSKSAAIYRLFPTKNMWTFIKLNTRNGQMWQVQYDVKGNSRFETILNSETQIVKENEANERFTLYPTENIYTFIMLDQVDGRLWQVQWSTEDKNRFIIRIE